MTAAGAVFPWLTPDDSDLRALVIEQAALDGKSLDTRIVGALQDITFERTIDGASTLSLILIDPDGDLLDSGLFNSSVDFELPAPNGRILFYRMIGVRPSPPTLTVNFEATAVKRLRGHKAVKTASRADMTRAEFVRMLVRAAPGVDFYSPELHKRQPIGTSKSLPTPAAKRNTRAPGFGSAAVQVKGKTATRAQLRLLEQALDTAISLKISTNGEIGLVMAMTQESVVSNDRGDRLGAGNPGGEGGSLQNVGVLHQDARYWPATRNVPRDVTPFLTKLEASLKAHKDQTIGWNVDQVQRSYTVNTPNQGSDYDQWQAEATATVAAYTGDDTNVAGAVTTTEYRKRFEFRTTDPGQPAVDYWTAIGNLANEVQWRAFEDLGTIIYASDDYLIKQAARQSLTRGQLPPGVIAVRVGDFDTGKDNATFEIDVFLDVLEPPIGAVWVMHGYGPCDGRYLLTLVRGSYLRPKATVTLTRAQPALPEPAAELGSHSDVTGDAVRGSLSGGHLEAAYNKAWEISAKKYPYIWGGGHAHVGVPDTGTAGQAHDQPGQPASAIGYDCSGYQGAIVKAAGYWPRDWGSSVPGSGTFATGWGLPGEGRFFTIWANSTHVFCEFKGMTSANKTEHFGTGRFGVDWSGAGFKPNLHPHAGFTPRHWDNKAPYDQTPVPGTDVTGRAQQRP